MAKLCTYFIQTDQIIDQIIGRIVFYEGQTNRQTFEPMKNAFSVSYEMLLSVLLYK